MAGWILNRLPPCLRNQTTRPSIIMRDEGENHFDSGSTRMVSPPPSQIISSLKGTFDLMEIAGRSCEDVLSLQNKSIMPVLPKG